MTNTTNNAGRVVVVGSLNMDLVIHAPRLPQAGETLIGHTFTKVHGGKGANQAVAAARLGAQVAMIGRVGRDDHGVQLLAGLQDEGIDCRGVSTDVAQPTGIASIVVDDAGQNEIVIVAGSNGTLTTEIVAEYQAVIDAADVVVCQLEVPYDTVFAVMQQAKASGKIVVLNPAPVTNALPREWLALADYLIPNELEASALSGVVVDSPHSAAQAAKVLQQHGAHQVMITLGQQGVFVLAAGDVVGRHYPSPVVVALDTTGAGDTFVGGFCAALANGHAFDNAVQFGQAAAALSVTRAGAQTSIPYLREVSTV